MKTISKIEAVKLQKKWDVNDTDFAILLKSKSIVIETPKKDTKKK